MIDAGRLRQRIDIQEPVYTQNATTGEMVQTWRTVHYGVPAAVEPLSVRDFIQSRSEQAEVNVRVMIRYRTGLKADMRILHRGKTYSVAGWFADKDSGLEYLTAPCSEEI